MSMLEPNIPQSSSAKSQQTQLLRPSALDLNNCFAAFEKDVANDGLFLKFAKFIVQKKEQELNHSDSVLGDEYLVDAFYKFRLAVEEELDVLASAYARNIVKASLDVSSTSTTGSNFLEHLKSRLASTNTTITTSAKTMIDTMQSSKLVGESQTKDSAPKIGTEQTLLVEKVGAYLVKLQTATASLKILIGESLSQLEILVKSTLDVKKLAAYSASEKMVLKKDVLQKVDALKTQLDSSELAELLHSGPIYVGLIDKELLKCQSAAQDQKDSPTASMDVLVAEFQTFGTFSRLKDQVFSACKSTACDTMSMAAAARKALFDVVEHVNQMLPATPASMQPASLVAPSQKIAASFTKKEEKETNSLFSSHSNGHGSSSAPSPNLLAPKKAPVPTYFALVNGTIEHVREDSPLTNNVNVHAISLATAGGSGTNVLESDDSLQRYNSTTDNSTQSNSLDSSESPPLPSVLSKSTPVPIQSLKIDLTGRRFNGVAQQVITDV